MDLSKNDNDEQIRFASGMNIALALWEIATPLIFGYWRNDLVAAANAVIAGLVILVMAWMRVTNPYSAGWRSVVSVVVALWLIAAPFVLHDTMYTGAYWNSVVIGIGVLVFAGWSALASRAVPPLAPAKRTTGPVYLDPKFLK